MPTQLHQAARTRIGGHISANMWLWIAVLGVATVAFGLARWQVGGGEHLGDLMALAGALWGTLIMIKSQQGFVSTAGADEAEVTAPASPQA